MQALAQCQNRANVLLVELETLPYSSRIVAPGLVEISSKNVRHPLAALPASRTNEACERLSPLLGACVPRSNILECALHNPNLIVHTTGTILNAPRIELMKGDFHMYREGFTESVWRVVHMLDSEKMAVMEQVCGKATSYFDAFVLRTFEDRSIDPLKGFQRYAQEAPSGPSTINTRYITEDVPIGLGLLRSLGSCLDVETPIAESLMRLAGALLGRDFLAESRTVESLWGDDVNALIEYVSR